MSRLFGGEIQPADRQGVGWGGDADVDVKAAVERQRATLCATGRASGLHTVAGDMQPRTTRIATSTLPCAESRVGPHLVGRAVKAPRACPRAQPSSDNRQRPRAGRRAPACAPPNPSSVQ